MDSLNEKVDRVLPSISYPMGQITPALKSLSSATRTNIRTNDDGFLCLQVRSVFVADRNFPNNGQLTTLFPFNYRILYYFPIPSTRSSNSFYPRWRTKKRKRARK